MYIEKRGREEIAQTHELASSPINGLPDLKWIPNISIQPVCIDNTSTFILCSSIYPQLTNRDEFCPHPSVQFLPTSTKFHSTSRLVSQQFQICPEGAKEK